MFGARERSEEGSDSASPSTIFASHAIRAGRVNMLSKKQNPPLPCGQRRAGYLRERYFYHFSYNHEAGGPMRSRQSCLFEFRIYYRTESGSGGEKTPLKRVNSAFFEWKTAAAVKTSSLRVIGEKGTPTRALLGRWAEGVVCGRPSSFHVAIPMKLPY